jgi:hypothetical protein
MTLRMQTAAMWRFIVKGSRCRQPLPQLGPTALHGPAPNSHRHSLFLADEDNEPLSSGDARIEEVASQHRVVLGHDRDDNGGVLSSSLAISDG